MTRFRFRLEKLQRLAERATREAANRLSDASRILGGRRDLQTAVEQARDSRGRPCPAPGTRVRAEALAAMNAHLVKLTADMERAAVETREQALVVEQKHREFLRAKREQRQFELLRDRRFAEWRTDNNRNEQHAMDETASHRYMHAAHMNTADIAELHGKGSRNV